MIRYCAKCGLGFSVTAADKQLVHNCCPEKVQPCEPFKHYYRAAGNDFGTWQCTVCQQILPSVAISIDVVTLSETIDDYYC